MNGSCKLSLTGNQLKLLALVTMTADHVGLVLLPQFPILRIIGRLAFPIYAWLIGEGCRHTRDLGRYFRDMALLALVCQLGSWLATGSLYQSVLVSFSIAIGLIWLLTKAKYAPVINIILFLLGLATTCFLCIVVPGLLPGTDFAIDYGLLGILLPILSWMGQGKWPKLVLFGSGLAALSVYYGGFQVWCLAALLPLALYSGTRGKSKVKYLFYFYYPAHLVIIYLLGQFL